MTLHERFIVYQLTFERDKSTKTIKASFFNLLNQCCIQVQVVNVEYNG